MPSSSVPSSSDALPLLPQDAVATSSHLQQSSVVRQLTRDLQKKNPKRPQLPPEKLVLQRTLHTAVYKQKLHHYNNSLKIYEQYLNELILQQAAELDKIIQKLNFLVNHFTPPSKLTKLRHISTISSQIISNNCANTTSY